MSNKALTRRDFLKAAGLGAAMLTTGGDTLTKTLEAAAMGGKTRPNIVLIMADDLGYAETGCYGQKKIKTPNIDRLAGESMRFTQFYSGSAVCAPARCSLMTGKHTGHAWVRDNYQIGDMLDFQGQLPLPPDTPTIAKMLKEQGYTTGAFGKWGLGRPGSTGDPIKNGFDRFFGYNCQSHAHNLYPRYLINNDRMVTLKGNTRGLTGERYAPQVIADEMLKFVDKNQDKPFFLYYATVLPHLALQVPEEEMEQYKGKWPETPYAGTYYQPHPTPRGCYAAMISFMDKQVGRLLDSLKEKNLADNTLVIFTSDNGTTGAKTQVDAEFFESVGPLRGLKGTVYEGGIRVPLLVRWPGKIKAGSVSDHLAAHYDIYYTLAEITGGQVPADTDGISFVPTLLSKPREQKNHEYLFWDFPGYTGQLAVRMGKWKGVKRDLQNNPDTALELFDLDKDIGETENLAGKHPDVAEQIEKIMLEARTRPPIKEFQFGNYADS